MKKPLQKLTRYDDVFQFFLIFSLLPLLLLTLLALAWRQPVWSHAAFVLLLLILGDAGGRLAFLRRKPKVLPCATRLASWPESYAEIDALLTEMEIPYYEHIANKQRQTSKGTADREQAKLTI
jgi:hypothetical protein